MGDILQYGKPTDAAPALRWGAAAWGVGLLALYIFLPLGLAIVKLFGPQQPRGEPTNPLPADIFLDGTGLVCLAGIVALCSAWPRGSSGRWLRLGCIFAGSLHVLNDGVLTWLDWKTYPLLKATWNATSTLGQLGQYMEYHKWMVWFQTFGTIGNVLDLVLLAAFACFVWHASRGLRMPILLYGGLVMFLPGVVFRMLCWQKA